MQKMLRAIPTILSLTACVGCGPNQRVEIVRPPVSLTTCAAEPEAPDLAAVDWSSLPVAKAQQLARDQIVFAYLLAMRSAWGDCSATVEGVRVWGEGLGG